MTTMISSGRGASGTDTVIVSKCSKDQGSSLWPSGTSNKVPGGATLTLYQRVYEASFVIQG